MTTSNDRSEKEANKEALKARASDMEKREKELNAGKTGKGLRVFLGMTRGRNPQEIQYEAFDDAQPDTLPSNVDEFMALANVKDEKRILSFLIEGFNQDAYTSASDPVAEFVDASWPEEVQKGFRVVVRNYSQNAGVSIEDAVNLIKPGIIAAQAKAKETAAGAGA